jgi:hypothetical protein
MSLMPSSASLRYMGVGTDRVVIAGEEDFLSPAVLQEIRRICKKVGRPRCLPASSILAQGDLTAWLGR